MGFDRRLPKANAHADVLSRSTPGPGQYDPKRTAQGSANLTGDPSGAHTATQHGFSADSGPSRDTSLRDYATTGPWASYPSAKVSNTALSATCASLPGPDQIPGSVGAQCLSTKRNGPKAVFSTAERFKVKGSKPEDGEPPGPGAYQTSNIDGMGKSKVSLGKGSQSWSLGVKLESSIYKSMPLDTPGAEYDAHKAVEIGGHLNVAHSTVLDRAPRLKGPKDNGVPGPGFYKATASLGEQTLSHMKSEPRVRFTKKLRTSDMPNGDPVFISRQHGSHRLGRCSPGPATHVSRLTAGGSSYIGGNFQTSYGSKTRPIAFPKEKKMRPVSTEGFYNPNNPGPGAYMTTSSMGKQILSNHASSSSAHKTTMERGVWHKQFLSAEHVRVEAQGMDSPGPLYDVTVTHNGSSMTAGSKRGKRFCTSARDAGAARVDSPGPAAYSVRRQFDVRPQSAPRKLLGRSAVKGASFSTEERSCLKVYDELVPRGDLHLSRSIDQTLSQGYDAPGPGQYLNLTESPQHLTTFGKGRTIKNSTPTWKIGTSKRMTAGTARDSAETPGPGMYTVSSSLGSQAVSRSKTAPNPVIPKSQRDKEAKVFISRMHSAAESTSESPGPAAYLTNDNTWKMNSKKKSSPSFGFGKSQRSNFLFS